MSEPYIGQLQIWGCNYAPRGWAFCSGALLSISEHMMLFSILGTTYGGDGRTNFALPNLKAHAPLGAGQSPGHSSYRLGQLGGSVSASINDIDQLPAHNHAWKGNSATDGTVNTPSSGDILGKAKRVYTTKTDKGVDMAAETVKSTGAGDAHENRQPFLALNFCIAIEGIYPSRN